MTAAPALTAVDDPDELAELTRPLPAQDGMRRLEAVLSIDGVSCAACVIKIEQALQEQVESISLNAFSRRARVVFRPDTQPLSDILARIQAVGYTPRPVLRTALALGADRHRRRMLGQMLVAVFCMMQVMMYAWPRYVAAPGELSPDLRQLLIWAEWVLSLPVLLLASGSFLGRAWRDLRARHLGMDVPVALGIMVTFVASSVGLATQGEVWFDSLTMFVAFLLVGRWLEARARDHALAGVTDLMAALPEMVERQAPDGHFAPVAVRHLQAGDLVRVAAGQTMPADGVLLDGPAQLDESLLTGESRACERAAGASVVAGSRNLSGPVRVRLTHRPRDSRLAQLADLVNQIATSKPRLAQQADRWAGRFTGLILMLAALTGLVWWMIDPARAPWIAASVLIVTCPCALSLATPAAMLAASANLARRGMLVCNPNALAALAEVDTAVFDKTGTLTAYHAQQVHIDPLPHPRAPTDARVRGLIAALTAGSQHPIAQALQQASAGGSAPVSVRQVQEWRGQGLSAEVQDGDNWIEARLGHADFVMSPDEQRQRAQPGQRAAGLWLSLDGQLCAQLSMHEVLRPDAASALAQLRAAGLHLAVLSGDHAEAVQALRPSLTLDTVRAQASPEDKHAQVLAWQRAGHRVLMVGDGINDAPVLAQADVSVSFAHGAALAQYHADLLVLNQRLVTLSDAHGLARKTLRVVRHNLAFAGAYNLLCVPWAMLGWIPPWLAGLGMAGSSWLVVLNALRLAPRARPQDFSCTPKKPSPSP